MDQEPLPPDLKWPKWRWLRAQWLGITGTVIGFVAFFVQGPDQPLLIRSLITVAVLVLAIFILPALVWFWGVATVACKRIRSYSQLHQRARRDSEALGWAMKQVFRLTQEVAADRIFELVKSRYYREKLYIVLKIKEDPKLSKGDILLVVHADDQILMGQFTVTEERSDGYYAVGTNNIDPVWLGQVRQAGEITTLPYMFANLI